MSTRDLHELLGGIGDTHELVISRQPDGDVLREVWRAACEEANAAYRAWREEGGRERYRAYRAAADRADAAQDALGAHHAARRRR